MGAPHFVLSTAFIIYFSTVPSHTAGRHVRWLGLSQQLISCMKVVEADLGPAAVPGIEMATGKMQMLTYTVQVRVKMYGVSSW